MDVLKEVRIFLQDLIRPIVVEAVKSSMSPAEQEKSKKYLTVKEVEEMYDLSVSAIYDRFKNGTFTRVKSGGRTQPVLGGGGVDGLAQLLQHHLAGAVAQLASGDLAVLDGHDGVIRRFLGDLMNHHLAAGTKLGGNALGDGSKHFQFMGLQHPQHSFLFC